MITPQMRVWLLGAFRNYRIDGDNVTVPLDDLERVLDAATRTNTRVQPAPMVLKLKRYNADIAEDSQGRYVTVADLEVLGYRVVQEETK